MSDIVYVDCETAGLDAERHEIWEVALIADDKTFNGFVYLDTWQMQQADPIGLSIGRFHERHPQGNSQQAEGRSYLPDLVAKIVARMTHGKHLVGMIPSFDEIRLRRLLLTHGFQPSWHYHVIDVEALAVGWLLAPASAGAPAGVSLPWKSEDLSRAVGVDPDQFDRHTAMGDCLWAKAIYEMITGGS